MSRRLPIKPVQGTNADVCTRRSCEDPKLHVGFRVRELHTKFDIMSVLGCKGFTRVTLPRGLINTSSVDCASVMFERFPWLGLGAPLLHLCDGGMSVVRFLSSICVDHIFVDGGQTKNFYLCSVACWRGSDTQVWCM